MTQVKQLSISSENEEIFARLKAISPKNTKFAQQVAAAVSDYVSRKTSVPMTAFTDTYPEFDASIEEWIEYIKENPGEIETIKAKAEQIYNISRGKYAI